MKKFVVAVAIFLAILLIALFVIYQYQAYAEPSLVTEKVIFDTVYRDVNSTAYGMCTETILDEQLSGVVNFTVENGEKASAGEVVARIYGSERDVYLNHQAKALTGKKEKLEYYQQTNGVSVDVKSVEKAIDRVLVSLAGQSAAGKIGLAAEQKEELELLQNQRLLLLGEVDSLQPQIDEVTAELERVRGEISQSIQVVTSPISGYIVQGLDNLESLLPRQERYTMTAAEFRERTAQMAVHPAEGMKVLSDFSLDLGCVVPKESIADLQVGQRVTLKFPFALDEELDATVSSISQEEGEERLLVLNCKTLRRELLTQRAHQVQIIKQSYSGLRINNSAIRVNAEGDTGVFAVIGNTATFRKVEILFADQNYSIAKVNNDIANAVLLYDEIITKGKDIYDGKVVR